MIHMLHMICEQLIECDFVIKNLTLNINVKSIHSNMCPHIYYIPTHILHT